MAWLNLTMPNQTVKNGLIAKKIKLPHINFSLNKQLIKFSCTYWLLSFSKILKKLLGPIQSYEDAPFLGSKWSICPKQIFFKKVINIIFIYLLAPFTLQNFELLEPIQGYDDVPFSGPKYPNLSWTNFFGTNHYYHFHLPIGTFHWAKFKKKNSYSWSRVVRMRHFWAKNIPLAPNKTFV